MEVQVKTCSTCGDLRPCRGAGTVFRVVGMLDVASLCNGPAACPHTLTKAVCLPFNLSASLIPVSTLGVVERRE